MVQQIAVTGSTGGIGGRVARRLAARGIAQRLVVRDTDRAPRLPEATAVAASYADPDALRAALTGVDTLLLVSAPESADRVALHTAAVDAAVDSGVSRVVYTSFLGAAADATFTFGRDHWYTEQHIRATGIGYTFLRDSLYADGLPLMVGADRVIRGPAGAGRLAPVTRDDIADVAVAALLDADHAGQTYDLTGPELMTLAEAAEHLSKASGRTVSYLAESLEEAYASRAGYGAPDWEVAGWVTSYAAIGSGEMNVLSDAVARVAGHQPTSVPEFLSAHPEVLDRLRQS
jgi:uncharacterized protein YbjT (DUF2867 family)